MVLEAVQKVDRNFVVEKYHAKLLEYMQNNIAACVGANCSLIAQRFLGNLAQNEPKTHSTYMTQEFAIVCNMINDERRLPWFKKARQTKTATVKNLEEERESKIRKIARECSVEFFSDPNIFIIILDFLSLNELLQIRLCGRFFQYTLEDYSLPILQKFKLWIPVKYCEETERIKGEISLEHKMKCVIAGVCKDKIRSCLVKFKAGSNKKHIDFTELLVESIASFSTSTLLQMELCKITAKSGIPAKVSQLNCNCIRQFNIQAVKSTITDSFPNQYIYYSAKFHQNYNEVGTVELIEFYNKYIERKQDNLKLMIVFCKNLPTAIDNHKTISVALDKGLLFVVIGIDRTYVVQGNLLCSIERNPKNLFRILNQYNIVALTSKRFFAKCFEETNYVETKQNAPFIQIFQRVHQFLDPFIH